MPDDVEARIRAKAHELWEQEGRPDGRAADHWEKARTLVALEDDKTSLKPIGSATSEPLEIQENLGELPGPLTDQGDRMQVPLAKAATRTDDPPTSKSKPSGRRASPRRS